MMLQSKLFLLGSLFAASNYVHTGCYWKLFVLYVPVRSTVYVPHLAYLVWFFLMKLFGPASLYAVSSHCLRHILFT